MAVSKRTPERRAKILQLLEDGQTDKTAAALSGINKDTFYTWIKADAAFSDAVTHARGIAEQRAVDTLRAAMKVQPTKAVEETVFEETRLNRKGEPYTYKRSTVTKKVSELAPDWRASIEYLKRRSPDEWAETLIVKITAEQAAALKAADATPAEVIEAFLAEWRLTQDELNSEVKS